MSCTLFEFTVGRDFDGSSVRVFLRKSCGITARSMTLLKYGEGGIYRGSVMLKACDTVHEGDVISLILPPESNTITPLSGSLSILYEDDYLLIVDKPAGTPVHPTKRHQLDTLANIVSFYQKNRGESYTFRALNRLDKDTSGCVVIVKDRLNYALVKNTVQKTYIAVCEGVITDPGTIDLPIGLADGSKIRRTVREDGCCAVTHYRPLQCGNGHTMLELKLETGRTHQIRCHMSAVGHPLAGDDLYGGSLRYIDRQALHCYKMSLLHPITKQEIYVESQIPKIFLQIIKEG